MRENILMALFWFAGSLVGFSIGFYMGSHL